MFDCIRSESQRHIRGISIQWSPRSIRIGRVAALLLTAGAILLNAPEHAAAKYVGWYSWTDDDGTWTVEVFDTDDNGVWDFYAIKLQSGEEIYQWTESSPGNPAPDDSTEAAPLPWEKNPLNLGQNGTPPHPAILGLERALQMNGGGALVQGKRGLGTLVNPADDDHGDSTPGAKPKTQTTGGIKADLATQGLADLPAIEEQVGLANGLGLTDAAYVQLHNPAESGGPVTDGDDDAPSAARPKQDGPMTPGGNGMPSLWDLARQSLVNPAPFDAAGSGQSSFVLLPTSIGVQGQQAGSGPRTPGPSLGLGSFGGQFTSATRTGVPRPPR